MEFWVLSEMGLIMFTWVFLGLFFNVFSEEARVIFLQTPASITNQISANFKFETLVSGNGTTCSTTCKLNNDAPSLCPSREVFYAGLKDGHHTCEVCSIGDHGVGCSSYKWIVDTVAPTAYVAAATSFTSSTNVSVNVSFNKPCNGKGSFQCTSVDSCNLLVYGAGQVIPTTLNTIQPNLRYSLIVSLASNVQYGRVLLAMDKNFCTDAAGNKFKGTQNSSFFVHFDRRSALVSLRTRIPERPVRLDGKTRTVQATNTYQNLELYLYFNKPVTNSIDDIINFIHTTQGSLVPIFGNSLGNRRFGFRVTNISRLALVTVSLDSELLASKYGTHVSPMAPFSFIYDSQRPAVKVSTKSNDVRTRHRSLQMSIRFMKPVLGFNSSFLSISGGYLQRFREVTASEYSVDIQFEADVVSINVPENITMDAAGNGNLASNILQVKHYSLPVISLVLSASGTATFLFAALAAGMLSISIASLQSMGDFGEISSSSIADPTSNLFRMAGHIQIFALSRWLPVALPVQYYELARGLHWSIPYFSLPWDMGHDQSVMEPSSLPAKLRPHSSKPFDIEIFKHIQPRDVYVDATYTSRFRSPSPVVEYKSFLQDTKKAESDFRRSPASDGWEHFNKRIFWLAVIGGSLILVHALLLLILKYRKTKSKKQKSYGALIFPRFEIFLINLALPCVCEAAAAIIKGGSTSGTIVGALLFGAVSFLLLASFSFLLVGITFGKLLQYKEINKEGHRSHRYHELTRVILGPGKRGQWTWRNQSNSVYLTIFGPLFEDLRGPKLYRFFAENQRTNDDRIIASGDKTVDAKAPFIQKLFGIIRIYQSFIETIKRVSVAILSGANFENKRPTKAPTIVSLCITSFQLVFMVLEKPFMKKEVQLVEVISVFCEVGIFTCCWLLLEMKFTHKGERNMMIIMIFMFVLSFLPQFINMYYALYRQIKRLDPAKESFFRGLLTASIGVMGYFILEDAGSIPDESGSIPEEEGSIPEEAAKATYNSMEVFNAEEKEPVDPSGDENEKPWAKVREHVKSSFSKKSGQTTTTDPSTSGAKWSELLGNKNAQSSSLSTSGDAEPKTDSTET